MPTWEGWLYLAVVLDAWNRKIVGWAMATHLKTFYINPVIDWISNLFGR